MAIETELKVRLTLEGLRSVRPKLEQLGRRLETESQTRHDSRHLSDRLLAGPDHCQFAGFRAAEPLGGDAGGRTGSRERIRLYNEQIQEWLEQPHMTIERICVVR